MHLHKSPITIHWGLEEEANLQLKSSSVGTIVQIGKQEFIAITQSRLVRFETSFISSYLPYQLTALVSIMEQEIVVGVTAISAEFVVILKNDIKNPIYPKIKTNDASIFNIVYLPKSKLLITSGEDLKVWSFDFIYNSRSIIPTTPHLQIEYQRTIIHNFHGSIMNPPIVDLSTEIIYIDDHNGSLQMYKASTGEHLGYALKFQGKSKTTIAYNSESKRFLTSNDEGTILYNKSGSFSNRYLLSNVAALAIRFITKEYAVILDANNGITLLDVKTSRSFICYKSEKPIKRLFFFDQPIPRLILCFNSSVAIFRITLPWKFWASTISAPLSMIRCTKRNEAARLLVMCSNSHLKLISPSLRVELTAATLSSLASPFSNNYFYDRSSGEIKRDQLMLPLKDGTIQIFSTGENPCKLISSLEAKAVCICLCKYKNKKCFVFGTTAGNLLFYDYQTLARVHRVVLVPFPIIKIYYCGDCEDDSLCLVYKDRLLRYSIKDEKMCESVLINGSELSISFDDVMIFAYENGEIGSAYFNTTSNCELVEHVTNGLKIHDDQITGLSLGLESDYFASSSLDMSLRIWSTKDITLIKKITFPVQLFSVAVLNGKRDVVVGTDSEIMIVNGVTLFGGIVDDEDDEYDNYDKKCDFLASQYAQISNESEETEASFLSGRKQGESSDSNDYYSNNNNNENSENNESVKKKKPKNMRLKRLHEALRKHEEMKIQKSNEDLNKIEEANKPAKKVIDPDERERLFNQMNEITNGKPKKPVMIPKEEPKEKKKKEEEEDKYEYEYEYENYSENEEEGENENESSSQNNETSNQDQNELTKIVKNSVSNSKPDENEQTKEEKDNNNNNNDDILMKIKYPADRNGNRSPKRQFRRSITQNKTTSTNKTSSSINISNIVKNILHSHDISESKSTNENNNNNNDYYSDLYYDSESDTSNQNESETSSRHKHKRKHYHHIQNNRKSSKHHHHHREIDDDSKSNIHHSINVKETKSDNYSADLKNKERRSRVHFKDQQNFLSKKVDRKTRMNLLLVNNTINEGSHKISIDKDRKQRSNSSLVKNPSFHTNNESQNHNQNQNQFIKMKPTRRFPTPLGFHFVHPGLSLFERSIKTRRPKTPDKENNGLIISRSAVPTNIILDATALDMIIESEDERYEPLIKQIKPLLRSNYNYYNERMRNLDRIHAHFNLNVMIPAYQRTRQQIRKQIEELERITKENENENKNENKNEQLNKAIIIPPLNTDELSSTNLNLNLNLSLKKVPQTERPIIINHRQNCFHSTNDQKPRSLLEIGKVRHSHDTKSHSIFRPDNKSRQRKASCPPKLHHSIILPAFPQSTGNANANNCHGKSEYGDYSNFISSLCKGAAKRERKMQKKPLQLAMPRGSLYVTGRPMMGNQKSDAAGGEKKRK